MRTTMDKAGRLVVPKALREELGLRDGGEVELVQRDGIVELSPVPVEVRVEQREYGPVLVADDAPPLTDDAVRNIVERLRR